MKNEFFMITDRPREKYLGSKKSIIYISQLLKIKKIKKIKKMILG